MEESITLSQASIAEGQRAFSPLHPLVLDVNLWERMVRRPHFDVYRIPCADGQFAVAKCARGPDEVFRQSLVKEFSALDEVRRRAGEVLAGTIPHTILFREKEGILLLSGMVGISLEEKLHRRANAVLGWKNLGTMREIGRALGVWMRTFHGSTASDRAAHNHCDYVDVLERNVCRSRQLGISRNVLEHVRNRAETVSKLLDGMLVEVAAGHGDFIPQNILLDGVQPRIIDFAAYSAQAPVYRDLSAFIAYVSLLASKPKYSRKALEVLALNFLDAYGDRLDASLLHIFVVNSTLRIIGDNPDNARSKRGLRRIEDVLLKAADENAGIHSSIKCFLAGDRPLSPPHSGMPLRKRHAAGKR